MPDNQTPRSRSGNPLILLEVPDFCWPPSITLAEAHVVVQGQQVCSITGDDFRAHRLMCLTAMQDPAFVRDLITFAIVRAVQAGRVMT